jgi:RNA polymerase sigma-70 factor (ECF subfamily)
MNSLSPDTSPTLLAQLRLPNPAAAWTRFERLYNPLIRAWARRQGFQDADAADLVQEIFVKLMHELPRYTRTDGGTFRGWLSRVATNAGHDFRRRKATRPLPAADGLSGADAPAAGFEEAEYRRELVASGLALIRGEFEERSWQAFERTAVRNEPPARVAADLGISKGAVYVAKSRVMARLRQVVTDELLD